MEIISSSTPTARKNHKCNYCGDVIPKGEKYESSFMKAFGDVYEWKNHIQCSEIASKLDMFDNCDEGLDEDGFHENIEYEYANLYAKLHPSSCETDPIPAFLEQLNFVINHNLTPNK